MTARRLATRPECTSAVVATRFSTLGAVKRLVGHVVVTSVAPASSVIGRLDYNWLTRVLRVSFSSGHVYEYRRVTWGIARTIWKAADGARSVGGLFNSHVRNDYPWKRTA